MTTTAKPILFLAFANDRDDRARYLRNLPEEARQVQRALAVAEGRGHCELVLRQNATAADILDVFQDARYQDRIALFHFGGHADGHRLLLETAAGAPAAANAGGLARFLAQQRGLLLVFLNGCPTSDTPTCWRRACPRSSPPTRPWTTPRRSSAGEPGCASSAFRFPGEPHGSHFLSESV